MKRILIFSGTTEGRRLAEHLKGSRAEVFVSVATEYGKECMEENENTRILSGRMDESEMEAFLVQMRMDLVVDATHPFAVEVTRNIRQACANTGTEYVRCLREAEKGVNMDGAVCVSSVPEAVRYLERTEGKILIATGSKELKEYTKMEHYRERCYARVLSTLVSVEESIGLGFEGKHLIAMQGPFSKEMNLALLHQTDAKYFVTKESGKTGGFSEKAEAAREAGAVLVVVGRPEESGKTPEETMRFLDGWLSEKCRGV